MNTEEFCHAFERDGFALWPSFLDLDSLSELRGQVSRFVEQSVPSLPSEHVFYEDTAAPSTLKQIQNMADHDPWFGELANKSAFCELAESVCGSGVIPKNLQFFSKPPTTGAPTPPHQDGYYFMLNPCEAITMWLALDDVDEENGCVRYVAGSHRRGMRPHARTTTLGFSQGIVDFPTMHDSENERAIPAQAGDLLVHHALTIHRADGNQSVDRQRRALGFVYYSEHAHVDEEAHAAYQRQLRTEMKAAGRIR